MPPKFTDARFQTLADRAELTNPAGKRPPLTPRHGELARFKHAGACRAMRVHLDARTADPAKLAAAAEAARKAIGAVNAAVGSGDWTGARDGMAPLIQAMKAHAAAAGAPFDDASEASPGRLLVALDLAIQKKDAEKAATICAALVEGLAGQGAPAPSTKAPAPPKEAPAVLAVRSAAAELSRWKAWEADAPRGSVERARCADLRLRAEAKLEAARGALARTGSKSDLRFKWAVDALVKPPKSPLPADVAAQTRPILALAEALSIAVLAAFDDDLTGAKVRKATLALDAYLEAAEPSAEVLADADELRAALEGRDAHAVLELAPAFADAIGAALSPAALERVTKAETALAARKTRLAMSGSRRVA